MANVQLAVAGDDTTQVILSVPGVQGPAGSNLPPSGTTHQLLYKQSSTDYDTAWKLITNDNVDAGAEIAVSKLADGSARQLLQTDAAGTGVEWTSNVDIPGTLDVASAATFDAAVTTTGLLSANGKISVPLASGEGPSIYFGTDTDTGIYSPGANQVALSTNGTGRLFVDASGNVGVATDAPGALFEIRPSSGVASASIRSSASSSTLSIRSGPSSESIIYFGDQDDSDVGQITYNHSGNYLAFRANGAEVGRFDSSGRLGIGTINSFSSRLTVKAENTSSTEYACRIHDSNDLVLFYIRNNGYIQTGTGANSPYNLTTASAANLWVGANGELRRSTSSLKYKTDVADANYGLQDLLNLRPVTYKGNNDGDTVFGGLIAEEVDAAGLTQFVQYAEDGTPDALAYGNMVSLCIKAIQEQQAVITELQVKVAALESA